MTKPELYKAIKAFLDAEREEIDLNDIYDPDTIYGYQNMLLASCLKHLKK